MYCITLQRLKSEGALGQQNLTGDDETCMGSISISNISVPLKNDFLQKGMKGKLTRGNSLLELKIFYDINFRQFLFYLQLINLTTLNFAIR